MFGFGRGRGGRGGGYWWGARPATAPAGYTYVGPCRCGLGPHAYYQDASGRIVPASAAFRGATWAPPAPTPTATELEQLRAEKAELERRLNELERKLGGTG